MYGSNWNEKREIASITKIMTCYTVLQLTHKNFNKHSTLVTVSKRASEEVGTTANLIEGHTFSVWDLLHGLMLPSGNDAAIALAEHFGDYLLKMNKSKHTNPLNNHRVVKDTVKVTAGIREKTRSTSFFPDINKNQDHFSDYTFEDDYKQALTHQTMDRSSSLSIDKDQSTSNTQNLISQSKGMFSDCPKISRFINEMNKNAEKLGMMNTVFDSPHGLANRKNKSTAYDIALLCAACVKMPEFNRITRAKSYT